MADELKKDGGPPEVALGDHLAQRAATSEGPSIYERIARVQSDLFSIREDLRDTMDDARDARFVRLCGELGILADEFLPEEIATTTESPKKAIISPCCHAVIYESRMGGVQVGSCSVCYKNVIRRNPETSKPEWLDGESPWTKKALREQRGV